MKRIISLLSIVLILGCAKVDEIEGPTISEGTLEEITIPASDPLIGSKGALVYLPPGYSPDDTTERYPVVYLLHGFGGTYRFWQDVEDIKEIADYLISTGEIEPMIIVLPDGYNALGGSFYTNSSYFNQSVFGLYEDYIVNDVVGYIDSHYNTDTTKRAIDGISMGGYGALKLAFKHSDIFKSASSHSGPIAFEIFLEPDPNTGYTMIDYVHFENPVIDTITGDTIGFQIPYPPILGPERPLTTMMFAMAGAFSPKVGSLSDFNIADYEFPLDTVPGTGGTMWVGVVLPFRPDGSIKDEIFSGWLEHDPLNLAEENASDIIENGLNIFFGCGDMDDYLLNYHADALALKLTELGINFEYEIFNGTLYPGAPGFPGSFPARHGTHLYLRIRESLVFHSLVFRGEG
jgi:S-formylglutathione hydrolase FrmB